MRPVSYITASDAGVIVPDITEATIVADGTAVLEQARVTADEQATFEETYGRGTGLDGTNSPNAENYKGSAHIEFEITAGNEADYPDITGDPDSTILDPLIAEAVPNNYRGIAWIQYDADIEGEVSSATTDAGQSFGITKNNQGSTSLIECVADNCKVVKDEFLLQFEEDESNTTTFTNAPGGDSNIRTTRRRRQGTVIFSHLRQHRDIQHRVQHDRHRNRCRNRVELWTGDCNHADRQ